MQSERFGKLVYVTRHAWERMVEREISERELAELLADGEARYKDERRLWLAKALPKRRDNLLCAAVVLEDQLVVKTVMHRFEWGEL